MEQAQQPLLLDELVSRLSPNDPVAILLGTPGSGKSTFLCWLALHMARASLTPGAYQLPSWLGREQVPILVQMREYAVRLDKEYLPLKQFLILQWSRSHPNLAMKLPGELSEGRCLVLFDGLDQVATVTITGSGFTGVTGVSFGQIAATQVTFISDTQITAVSPAGTGVVDVTVTTPGGTSATSYDDEFSYQ